MLDMSIKKSSINKSNTQEENIDYFFKYKDKMSLQDRILFKNLDNDIKLKIRSFKKK